MKKAIKQAGVELWPRLWQNCRATRQTELSDEFESHHVCQWLGNSLDTAQDHYLRTYQQHFAAAVEWKTDVVHRVVHHPGKTAVKQGSGGLQNPRKEGIAPFRGTRERSGRDCNYRRNLRKTRTAVVPTSQNTSHQHPI
jgi:hypothetical protein